MSLSKHSKPVIDESKIVTITEVLPSLKCVYCKNILRNAMQTACGCRYCEQCVIEYLQDEDPRACISGTSDCVFVSLTMTDYMVRIDHAARKELSRRKVKCLNFDNGCSETPEYKNLIGHLSQCVFGTKSCPLCGKCITKSDEQSHAENECEMRLVTCPLCKKENIKKRDLEAIHKNLRFCEDSDACCPKFVSQCPYCNKGSFDRFTIQDHSRVCEAWKTKCMYCKFGCLFEGDPKQIEDHYTAEMQSHLMIVCECIRTQELAIEKLEKDGNAAFEKIDELKQQQRDLQTLATNAQVRTAEIMENTSRSVAPSRDRGDNEFVPRNGCLVWKINDYREKCESGASFYTSDPFYTSNFGFKLCSRIYLNGDGAGQGTHVSLFIVIMPGEYDDILSWPFKHKVTISILDQQGRNNPYSHTFRPDPSSPCFAKPQRNSPNVASGVPCFIRKALLDPNSGSRFISNNCIFVKVQVDVSS